MKKVEEVLYDVCEDFDRLRKEAVYWKAEYDELNAKYCKLLSESIAYSQLASLRTLDLALSKASGEPWLEATLHESGNKPAEL